MPSLPRLSDSALRLSLVILIVSMLHLALAVPVDDSSPSDPESVPNARVIVFSILGFLAFVGINVSIVVVARRRKRVARAAPPRAAPPLDAITATIPAPDAVVNYNHRGFTASATRPVPPATVSGESMDDVRGVQFVLDIRA